MMKKIVLKAVAVLFVLTATISALEWQEFDHGFKAIEFKDVITFGGYQFATVDKARIVYRRKAGGGTWEKVYDDYPSDARFFNYDDSGFNFLKDMLFLDRGYSGKFVSRDTGITWDSLTFDDEMILIDARDIVQWGDTLIDLSWTDSVYLSFDLGETKTPIFYYGEERINCVEKVNDTLFLGGWGRVFRSHDWGNTWDTLITGLPGRTAIRGIAVMDSNTIYVSTDEGVYGSFNGGVKWRGVDLQFSATDFSVLEQFTLFDNSVYGISKNRLFRLSAGEMQFTEVQFIQHENYEKSSISLFDNKLCVSSVNGVYECTVGSKEFVLHNSGVEDISQIEDIHPSDNYLYLVSRNIGGFNYLLRSTLDGSKIDTLFVGKGINFTYRQNDHYQKIELDSTGYYSSDSGLSWEKRESEPNPLYDGYPIDTIGNTLCYYVWNNCLYSNDMGVSWDTLKIADEGYRYCTRSGNRTYFYKFDYTSKGPNKYCDLYYSDDNGQTFHEPGQPLNNYKKMPSSPRGLLSGNSTAICGKEIFTFTKDQGQTWTSYPNCPINRLLSFKDSLVLGYVEYGWPSVPVRCYYSVNYGKSWTVFPATDGEPEHNLFWSGTSLAKQNSSAVYCVRAGRLYSIEMPDLIEGVGVINNKNSISGKQSLFTSSLNSTDIRVQLHMSNENAYTINLLTPAGRLIRSSSGVVQSGVQAISVDRSGLSHGYYLLQVIAGDRKEVRPIIVQ